MDMTNNRLPKRVALALAAVLAVPSFGASACDVGGAVLGAVLDGLMEDVQETVGQAETGVKDIVGNAGSTLALSIDAIRADYDDALSKTVDKLDKASTLKIHELERVVQDFTASATQMGDKLAKQGQQIANTMPLANTAPQVTDFSPRMIGVNPAEASFQLRVSGNFHSTLPEGQTPRLVVDKKPISPSSAITNELVFDLSSDVIPAPKEAVIASASLRLRCT